MYVTIKLSVTFLLAVSTLFSTLAPVVAAPGSGSTSTVDGLLKRVEKKFEHVNSIKLKFYQTVFTKGQSEPIKGRGTAWFERPDKMRWEYEAPEREVIVVSQGDVFIWEPEANQVMVYKKRRFVPGNLGNIFFARVEGLEEDFDIRVLGDSGDRTVLELTPRHELGNVKVIQVTFSKGGQQVPYEKIMFVDTLGTRTEIRLEDFEINPHLKESLFEFQIPDGARVYYQQ